MQTRQSSLWTAPKKCSWEVSTLGSQPRNPESKPRLGGDNFESLLTVTPVYLTERRQLCSQRSGDFATQREWNTNSCVCVCVLPLPAGYKVSSKKMNQLKGSVIGSINWYPYMTAWNHLKALVLHAVQKHIKIWAEATNPTKNMIDYNFPHQLQLYFSHEMVSFTLADRLNIYLE